MMVLWNAFHCLQGMVNPIALLRQIADYGVDAIPTIALNEVWSFSEEPLKLEEGFLEDCGTLLLHLTVQLFLRTLD